MSDIELNSHQNLLFMSNTFRPAKQSFRFRSGTINIYSTCFERIQRTHLADLQTHNPMKFIYWLQSSMIFT